MRIAMLILAAVASLGLRAPDVAPTTAAATWPSVPDWQDHAERYLIRAKDPSTKRPRLFSRKSDAGPRCVLLNNYWCLYQRSGGYAGSVRNADGAAQHDHAGNSSGHAMFVHPKWSAAAAFRWFAARVGGGDRETTAYALAIKYSPWCDTKGSRSVKVDKSGRTWGRGCDDRGNRPPTGFNGPLCREPVNRAPAPGQCDACNCPLGQARFWMTDTKLGPDAPIRLYDTKGRPTGILKLMLPRVAQFEYGEYRPTVELMNEGAALYMESLR